MLDNFRQEFFSEFIEDKHPNGTTIPKVKESKYEPPEESEKGTPLEKP